MKRNEIRTSIDHITNSIKNKIKNKLIPEFIEYISVEDIDEGKILLSNGLEECIVKIILEKAYDIANEEHEIENIDRKLDNLIDISNRGKRVVIIIVTKDKSEDFRVLLDEKIKNKVMESIKYGIELYGYDKMAEKVYSFKKINIKSDLGYGKSSLFDEA